MKIYPFIINSIPTGTYVNVSLIEENIWVGLDDVDLDT